MYDRMKAGIAAACAACAVIRAVAAPAAARDFGPWEADVAVGDRALAGPMTGTFPERRGTGVGARDAVMEGALLMIRVFQVWVSPQDGPSCRFHPVCSVYGRIAVARYGAFLGSILAGDRILRCNIFSGSGEDPVPDLDIEGK
jgi:putative membrane protein insertion efficiency factor